MGSREGREVESTREPNPAPPSPPNPDLPSGALVVNGFLLTLV